VDPAWPKVPPQWKLGDASSVAIDAQDNVWVLHRPRTLKPSDAAKAAPPVIVFDTAGNYVKSWGGAASGYEWPEREHGIHIDYKGFVWLGGNNCPTNGLPGLRPVADDQLLKFTQDGKFVMQIGRSNQSQGNADTRNLHRPADVWVYPQTNELFVADGYGNHRVAVFDADSGAFKRMWGAFGNKPADDDHCEIVTPSSFSNPGPEQLSIVHAIRVAEDGTVYVADREYRRVQMFTKDGKFESSWFEPIFLSPATWPYRRMPASSSFMSAATRAFSSSTARRWRSWVTSSPPASSGRAIKSRWIRKATSISRRPRPDCRS
jgi:hypothetical protein